ncbi:uncharacterized protein LOC132069321 [Lycium ferocissimum]|uniref:uncharacterized protein LOC132069321 n=1 Tax=Lycium ferocissimum TaxID=112874 RepID=UPI0028165F96|nr:uncharacterized protein LOC132069321 [Lycium ferocissimum]
MTLQRMYSKAGPQKFKKNLNLYCKVCKLKGHTKEFCYRVVGYPPGFKSKRREHATYNVYTEGLYQQNSTPGHRFNETYDGAVRSGSTKLTGNLSQVKIGGSPIFSKGQYEQIVQLLNANMSHHQTTGNQAQTQNQSASANAAGSLQWEGEGDW